MSAITWAQTTVRTLTATPAGSSHSSTALYETYVSGQRYLDVHDGSEQFVCATNLRFWNCHSLLNTMEAVESTHKMEAACIVASHTIIGLTSDERFACFHMLQLVRNQVRDVWCLYTQNKWTHNMVAVGKEVTASVEAILAMVI